MSLPPEWLLEQRRPPSRMGTLGQRCVRLVRLTQVRTPARLQPEVTVVPFPPVGPLSPTRGAPAGRCPTPGGLSTRIPSYRLTAFFPFPPFLFFLSLCCSFFATVCWGFTPPSLLVRRLQPLLRDSLYPQLLEAPARGLPVHAPRAGPKWLPRPRAPGRGSAVLPFSLQQMPARGDLFEREATQSPGKGGLCRLAWVFQIQ